MIYLLQLDIFDTVANKKPLAGFLLLGLVYEPFEFFGLGYNVCATLN
jgi:hypothetical protein